MLYFIRLNKSKEYLKDKYDEILYFSSHDKANDYLLYRSGLDTEEIINAEIEKLDIGLAYYYNEKCFNNINDILSYINKNYTIIKDKRIKHDFKVDDIVYVAIRDKIRKCKVTKVDDDCFEEDYDEETTLTYRTYFSQIELFDLSLEFKDEKDIYKIYSYRKSQINEIKRTIEELIAD